jgi:Flp pilus assembly protein TadD
MDLMKKQAAEMKQKQADIKRDLEIERQVANDVVAGQLRQMAQMERVLAEKSKQLETSNEQIASLTRELEESRDAYSELQEERDGLMRERDHMAALLKLNESGRIEELIAQNVGLSKSLREAKEQVERLNLDNNAAKDDIVEAQRNLAIAKSQINRLHQEKREQDKRILEVTEKLRFEEALLVKGEVDADPQEVEMLREVIRRQLRVQERRRQAKELLVDAVKSLGKEDDRLREAIELFDGTELVLSPDEQKLVTDQNVDGEFLSPTFARDRETVGREVAKLNVELESYNRAANKAYLAGRYHSTRELFEMMIEQHPGHIPAICRLGVVQLKLQEPVDAAASFQKAIELDKNNPYANRMLGFSFMQLDDLERAEKYLQRAIDLAPDDAKSYMLMGAICHLLGNSDEAESQFKGAIAADPMPSEPYFNIAMICANQGRMKDAKQYYNKALERGAVPDQELESKIMKN